MKVEKITYNNITLALIIRGKDWQKGLDFISASGDFQQVGFWGYDKGQKLAAHIHLEAKREILKTQEVIFIKSGSLKADLFSENGNKIASVLLKAGDTAVFLDGGHGYEILENNTLVLEVKNGPYVGPEKDRKRIHPVK